MLTLESISFYIMKTFKKKNLIIFFEKDNFAMLSCF